MRDNKPFGEPGIPQGGQPSWLDVNAELIVYDKAILKVPFEFVGFPMNVFKPLHTHFRWQTVKEIEVAIAIDYYVYVPTEGEGKGHYKISAKWSVDYDDDGIKLTTIRSTPVEMKGEGDYAVHADAELYQPSLKGDLQKTVLLLKLNGGLATDGVTVSYGPFSAPFGKASKQSLQSYEFIVVQLATEHPDKPLPGHLLKYIVSFEKEDQSFVSTDQGKELRSQWIAPLQKEAPELADAIKAGKCPMTLTGHASATGRTKVYNAGLSAERITSVAKEIKKHFGDKIAYVPVPRGQMDTTQRGPSPQEKYVEIEIHSDAAKPYISKTKP
ncbi:hypothetical protein [Bradyrhizobium sp. Arg816]|uniref:hypothetical protein n=1 Tax=Bradyrhizobium sp. Arg816 TaxID=2998491 RepID=UPI00249F39C9|nr:hypothetical protein [Bradyrhizobium sp. Arg816]MDI3560223.1 hypothetical protein [Bradyrhizobium sp. Arg816]